MPLTMRDSLQKTLLTGSLPALQIDCARQVLMLSIACMCVCVCAQLNSKQCQVVYETGETEDLCTDELIREGIMSVGWVPAGSRPESAGQLSVAGESACAPYVGCISSLLQQCLPRLCPCKRGSQGGLPASALASACMSLKMQDQGLCA